MNPSSPSPNGAGPILQFANFPVSWAGGNPFGSGFCFGSEDGRLLVTNERGEPFGQPDKVSASEEAINGLAWSYGWLAITTRADVNFLRPSANIGTPPIYHSFPLGAHGVVTAPSGHFVVILGQSQLMVVKPGSGPGDPVVIIPVEEEGLNLYRVIAFPGEAGEDLLVCAGRRGGICLAKFQPGLPSTELNTHAIEGLDVVDVTGIGTTTYPRALAAVARDGTLLFIRDAVCDTSARAIRFPEIRGAAYRLLHVNGCIFLLISKGGYMMLDLAKRYLEEGESAAFATPTLTLDMEAADANLAGGKWILVVLPDGVMKLAVDELRPNLFRQPPHGDFRELRPIIVDKPWSSVPVFQRASSQSCAMVS